MAELATRIPDRIASLTLAVTTAGGRPWSNLPPVSTHRNHYFSLIRLSIDLCISGTRHDPVERVFITCKVRPRASAYSQITNWQFCCFSRLMIITDPHVKVPIILDMVFPQSWLAEQATHDTAGRTNREVQTDVRAPRIRYIYINVCSPNTAQIYLRRIEITRPQTLIGALSQMSAGLTHHVTPARLSQISNSIPKVAIITGDQDNLVAPSNSVYLKKHMKEAEYVVFEGTGHAINAQRKERFNALLERVFREGRTRAGQVPSA